MNQKDDGNKGSTSNNSSNKSTAIFHPTVDHSADVINHEPEDGGKSLNWWDQFSVKSGTANQSISKPNNSAQLTPSPGVGITVSRGKITEHLGRSGKVFHGPSAALGLGFGQPGGSSVPVVDINMDLGEDHSLFNPNDALKRPRQHSAVSGSKDFNESNIILLAGLAQRASREQ
ncbi:hypothetical protein V6N11_039509 [Hibiscus sabdariffa]|uniref:Uncharacterized protein n=1 Tax=Hibiscus sabdariffa TaxID=183260 RepID=A0ABR2SNP1_9ROSI